MKIHRLFCVAAIMISPLMSAKLPFTNEVFGRLDGTLDFCAKADSQDASRFEEAKKAAIKDVPEKDVADARGSKEYKDSYELITSGTAKTPKAQAEQACKAYLEGK